MKSNLLTKKEAKERDILPNISKAKPVKEYKLMNKTALKIGLLKKTPVVSLGGGNKEIDSLKVSKDEISNVLSIKENKDKDKDKELLHYSSKIKELENKIKALELSNKEKDEVIEEKESELSNEKLINHKLSKENEFLIQKNHAYQNKLRQYEIERNLRSILIEMHSKRLEDAYENDVINQLYPDPDSMSYEELLALGERIGEVSRGLSNDQIEKIKILEYNKTQKDSICSICFSEYKPKEKIKELSCKHCFHITCIDTWLKKEKKCPFCKEEIKLK